ncbi:hypothetical protein D0N38_21165 [Bacillus inaquosorum]|nr:hypothetical protein D0N38_21165 [Bacillus inaquosorum]
MAGQFPDAPDLHSFWEHLKKGHDGVHELPAITWIKENIMTR